MEPLVTSALIGAGTSGLSTMFQSLFAKRQAKYAKEVYDHQIETQKQLINEQNEYNSPANQVKRLQEAGLNPALAYNNSSVIGSTQKSVATGNYTGTPNYQNIQAPLQDLGQYIGLLVQKEQLKGIKEDNRAKRIANDMAQDEYNFLFGTGSYSDSSIYGEFNPLINNYRAKYDLPFRKLVTDLDNSLYDLRHIKPSLLNINRSTYNNLLTTGKKLKQELLMLDDQGRIYKSQANMLEKSEAWQTTNQVIDAISRLLGSFRIFK